MAGELAARSDWFVVGFRTPFFRYHSADTADLGLAAILQALLRAAEPLAQGRALRNVLIGNAFSPQPIKSVRFLEHLRTAPSTIRNAASRATVACVEGACLSSLNALLLAGAPPTEQIDLYVGFEDLSVSRRALVSHGAGWPGCPTAGEMCRQVSASYGITLDEARKYVSSQVARASAATLDHIVPVSVNGKPVASDVTEGSELIIKSQSADQFEMLPFMARFSKGGTVLISTADRELAKRHQGLRILASCSLSTVDASVNAEFIVECAMLALSRAGLSWSEAGFIELYDGYVALTLAALQRIEHRAGSRLDSRLNLLGGAVVRGDPVAAVGGLMITNAETLLYRGKPRLHQTCLIVGYSAGSAVSLVVSPCT